MLNDIINQSSLTARLNQAHYDQMLISRWELFDAPSFVSF